MTSDPVRLGVAGLGRGFVLMLPSFRADPRVTLVADAAPPSGKPRRLRGGVRRHRPCLSRGALRRPTGRGRLRRHPHQMHRAHVCAALEAGKHVLVDKPLAVSMEDADAMVAAAEAAGRHLTVGPSHSFDPPVELAARMIESGDFGSLRMIQALNYTDFLYRPRRPEELRSEEGGGILFSQAIHQIDLVRRLAGGMGTRLTAMTGAWDPARPTEGAYSALLSFASGAFATLTYSGYAHFDSDIWMDNVGELGQQKDPAAYGRARRALEGLDPEAEAKLKQTRTYGSGGEVEATRNEHFGPVIALCDRADLRLHPDGVEVFGDTDRHFVEAPFGPAPRRIVMDALVNAVRLDTSPPQTGAWGRASLEICHAILDSAATGQPVDLRRQCGIA